MRRIRWLMARLALVGGGLAVATLLCEIALRVLGVSFPLLYTYDPDLASSHLPNASGMWITEGRARVRISSQGLRDHEHEIPKPQDEFRIALLGDSFSEAFQVDLDETFWSIAEREMKSCFPEASDVQFVNFGVATYGTAQHLIRLKRDVWKFKPNVVLLAFTPQNDVWENSKSLSMQIKPYYGDVKPFFELQEDKLVLDDSFLQTPAYVARSSTYECIKAPIINASYGLQLLKQIKQKGLGASPPQSAPGEAVLEEARSKSGVYAAPETDEWRAAWRLTERLIRELHEEADRNDAEFRIMVLSTDLQAYPDPKIRERFMQEQQLENLFYTNQRIEQLGAKSGFLVLNTAPMLQAHAEKHNVLLHGFENTPHGMGHYNEAGHRVVGSLLAKWLCADRVAAPPK